MDCRELADFLTTWPTGERLDPAIDFLAKLYVC